MLSSPSSLDKEHEEIMELLRNYAKLKDKTGEAIRGLEEALVPHFKKETKIVTPVLGLLPSLVKRETPKNLREIAESQEGILLEYENMFREHAEIQKLVSEGKLFSLHEEHNEVADLMDGLAHHMKVEEEVFYPAALIAGTVAKCLMSSSAPKAIGSTLLKMRRHLNQREQIGQVRKK
ncbi:MAG TPA: hemerythrin domain-containing protein [Nitrososphaerales archaeon]|nr:hemerythrin domain-containing protein [Nitrososphaerales archaeon]